MAATVSLVIGLIVGAGFYHLLLVTGSSTTWVRREQQRREEITWGDLAPTSTSLDAATLTDVETQVDAALAAVRFGPCHPEQYDPRDYDIAMQCPSRGGHDLTPGEQVMVIENADAPEGRWLVCSEHVFEPRVWERHHA